MNLDRHVHCIFLCVVRHQGERDMRLWLIIINDIYTSIQLTLRENVWMDVLSLEDDVKCM